MAVLDGVNACWLLLLRHSKIVTILLLFAVSYLPQNAAALRFHLAPYGASTCFECDVRTPHGADDHSRATVIIRFESNVTRPITTTNSHATVAIVPHDLLVTITSPPLSSSTSPSPSPSSGGGTRQHRALKTAAGPLGRGRSLRFSLFDAGGGQPGLYSVCFALNTKQLPFAAALGLSSSSGGAAPPALYIVTLEIFAGEIVTLPTDGGRTINSDEQQQQQQQQQQQYQLAKSDRAESAATAMATPISSPIVVRNEDLDVLEGHLHNVHRLLKETTSGVSELRGRHIEMQATSNSTFTRVWVMALLTVVAMALTALWVQRGARRTLREKKMV